MDRKKFIGIQRSIRNTRSSASLRSPIVIGAIILFLIIAVHSVGQMGNAAHAQQAVINLSKNQTYINLLATNTNIMAHQVVSLSSALASVYLLDVVLIFGFLIAVSFLLLVWISARTDKSPEMRQLILDGLKKEGFTDKDVEEYLKEKNREDQLTSL